MPHDRENRQAADAELGVKTAEALGRIARRAQALADVKTAYVAVVAGDRLSFLGAAADAPSSAPRARSIVDMALRKRDVVWFQEALREKRLANDPFVVGAEDTRFYAAAPMIGSDGRRIGAVAVFDRRVRPYDGELAEQLRGLAAEAVAALEPPKPSTAAPSRPRQAALVIDKTLINARVLLAEDHATNRKVIELVLRSAGVDLVSVGDGAAALEASAAGGFDLILMDMQMPVMDGLTATRLIREREAASGAPPIPILCLTANAMPEHIAASQAAGADSHLTKPITAAALLGAVREATEGQAAAAVRRAG